jgi:hypothetical protein
VLWQQSNIASSPILNCALYSSAGQKAKFSGNASVLSFKKFKEKAVIIEL